MSDLPAYAAALATALDGVQPLAHAPETIDLASARGRVLADDVRADRDLPPFDRAQMDGYAIRAADVGPGRSYPVVAAVPAGSDARVSVPSGHCVTIATGAPMPTDVDTVVQHERSDRADPVRFTIDRIEPGHAVHPRAADAAAGAVLVPAGTVLAAHHLAIAASVGAVRLGVARRPRAVILTSGDEVVAPDATPAAHQIRNSNAVLVAALLERCGAQIVRWRHVGDEQADTDEAVGAALSECDLLVTVGGISAGVRDRFPAAFERCGVALSLRGAAIQPGKPVIVGRAGAGVVVGLPGNPVSVLACACLFAWPIARRLAGIEGELPWRTVELGEPVRPNPRRQAFRPARLIGGDRAVVPSWAGSGDLAHTAPTHGLVELPVQPEPVERGSRVRFLAWP